jgi:hypothetical protein
MTVEKKPLPFSLTFGCPGLGEPSLALGGVGAFLGDPGVGLALGGVGKVALDWRWKTNIGFCLGVLPGT